jgi:methylated-DNA-[protein]-cysteine S-methyltransferase
MDRLLLPDTPIGPLELRAQDGALTGVRFDGDPGAPTSTADPLLREVAAQLTAYLAGERETFELPLHAAGTPFQRAVWEALARIPHGTTTTYGELAAGLGRPDRARAVGAANGANPLPIVVPCHRVIGARGALTGFGGGLERKRWLLAHEGALLL